MKRGSFAVETSLLMGLLIPLLVGVIYVGFYMRAGGEAYGNALEKVFRTALLDEAVEGAELQTGHIRAEAEIAVPDFPFRGIFFEFPEMRKEKAVLDRQKPAKAVFRLHSLKKVARQVQKE